MQKLVSVIIPTYNRADQIVEAIRSVKAQTYPAIQLIVADDGSRDDTVEILKQFDGIEYYYQENKGQGAARNLGLKHARGEYIASLDSDDIWQEDFLTVAVRALEHYEADFVFLNWTEIFEGETRISGWEKVFQNAGRRMDVSQRRASPKPVSKNLSRAFVGVAAPAVFNRRSVE